MADSRPAAPPSAAAAAEAGGGASGDARGRADADLPRPADKPAATAWATARVVKAGGPPAAGTATAKVAPAGSGRSEGVVARSFVAWHWKARILAVTAVWTITSLCLTRISLLQDSVASSVATAIEWALRRAAITYMTFYPYLLVFPQSFTLPRPLKVALVATLAVDLSFLLLTNALAPAQLSLWWTPSRTSLLFRICYTVWWMAQYVCYFVVLPLVWRKAVQASMPGWSTKRSLRSAVGWLGLIVIAYGLLALLLRVHMGTDTFAIGPVFSLLMFAAIVMERKVAHRFHTGYLIAFSIAQVGVSLIPSTVVELLYAEEQWDSQWARPAIMLAYNVAMIIIERTLRLLAAGATERQFASVLLFGLQLFDHTFRDLVYLALQPWTVTYFIVLVINLSKDFLRVSGILRRLMNRLLGQTPPSTMLELQSLLRHLVETDTSITTARLSKAVVVMMLLVDSALRFGKATVSQPIPSSQLLSVVLSLGMVAIGRELIVPLSLARLRRSMDVVRRRLQEETRDHHLQHLHEHKHKHGHDDVESGRESDAVRYEHEHEHEHEHDSPSALSFSNRTSVAEAVAAVTLQLAVAREGSTLVTATGRVLHQRSQLAVMDDTGQLGCYWYFHWVYFCTVSIYAMSTAVTAMAYLHNGLVF
eukprot:PLAT521.2.p1 GENE.PLAT521.2~~PLAT521.2.p1  ORF type:complete len:661 (-),score=205.70 PLAT521.2:82-2025(-)